MQRFGRCDDYSSHRPFQPVGITHEGPQSDCAVLVRSTGLASACDQLTIGEATVKVTRKRSVFVIKGGTNIGIVKSL